LLWIPPALAFTVDVPLSDSVLEEKARGIFREIRCMVCAGEAIADSNAIVASDMRRDIREKIASGMTIEEIKADYSNADSFCAAIDELCLMD
jgi:cytochrome c-type biogenesis protein CcmH